MIPKPDVFDRQVTMLKIHKGEVLFSREDAVLNFLQVTGYAVHVMLHSGYGSFRVISLGNYLEALNKERVCATACNQHHQKD